MTESSTDQDEFFAELIGFLQDPKIEVQRLAAEGLLDQTESQELIGYCQKKPRAVAKALLRLSERAEAGLGKNEGAEEKSSSAKAEKISELKLLEANAAGAAALKALVNLSAIPAVCAELVDMNAGRRCCEALRGGWLEGRSSLAHWYSMLLANVTLTQTGQKALASEESLVRFLFAAFVSKNRPEPRDGYDDPMISLGKVINNVCALREGRKILSEGEAGSSSLNLLAAELGDRQRRPDVIATFRNLCLDESLNSHAAIVSTDFLARVARFIYPWTQAQPENRADLPSALQEMLEQDGAALTGDTSVRLATAHSILGLSRSLIGRDYLREFGMKEVLRAWHTEESDEETKTVVAMAVPFVSQSEEELTTGGYLDNLPTSAKADDTAA